MMKKFARYLTAITMTCAFLFVRSESSFIDDNKGVAMDSLREINLRGSVRIQQPRGVRLNSFTRHRRTEGGNDEEKTEETQDTSSSNSEGTDVADNETEELENIEKEFGNEDEASEKETEELENIKKEFEGDGGIETTTIPDQKEPTSTIEVGEAGALSTIDPTVAPVVAPTNAPVAPPTGAPVVAPTGAPVVAPTGAPVVAPTSAPVAPPTYKPTPKYNTNQDDYDPVKAEDEKEELESELEQEEKVARRAGGLGIFFGIIAMIFTAHQMSENPDGIYASVCRLAITISSVVIKIVCMPCRKLIGGGSGNPYSGHMPISTSDYSYRNDPYRSNANAGFEMR